MLRSLELSITRQRLMQEPDPHTQSGRARCSRLRAQLRGMRTSTRQPDMEREPVCVVGIADIASIRTGREFPNRHTRKMIWRITADRNIRLQGTFLRSMSVCRSSVNMKGRSESIRESWPPMIRISRRFNQKPTERTSEKSFRKNL